MLPVVAMMAMNPRQKTVVWALPLYCLVWTWPIPTSNCVEPNVLLPSRLPCIVHC